LINIIYLQNNKKAEELKNEEQPNPKPVPQQPYPPEIVALIDLEYERHWHPWINAALPILGNISPTEAIKTRNGRQMVKALLDDFEHIEKHGAPGQSQQKYIDWARQQLGLV
jgi:hypothetical protein